VAFVTAIGLVGPYVAPHEPSAQFRDTLVRDNGMPRGPGERAGHLLGGDPLGRDELSRLLHGARVSMAVAYGATSLAVLLGVLVGLLSGYFGGAFDTVSMRFVDIVLSMPFLLIAIVAQRAFDAPGLWSLCAILGALSWTTLARVTRAK